MQKKIQTVLISVFYKDGLDNLVHLLHSNNVKIFSTGGTKSFIEKLGIPCTDVESLTGFPSILGGRVKTLHPAVFGGILGKRDDAQHVAEMKQFNIPDIDMVVVDLYPFEETVKQTTDESLIIEKIDIGGPSMIRAAAKNHKDVLVLASKDDYLEVGEMLQNQQMCSSLEQRREYAIKAFDVCTAYDQAISNYFHKSAFLTPFGLPENILRYGENPHQKGVYYGNLDLLFIQLHGKALSYNNLVDVESAIQLIYEFSGYDKAVFGVIKHTNVCGIAARNTVLNAWEAALAGDPESAFGGVLVCNQEIDEATANKINTIFFEVLIAPSFSKGALDLLQTKKNRILLQNKMDTLSPIQMTSLLNGLLVQNNDDVNYNEWKVVTSAQPNDNMRADLEFANLIVKHLKSNAIGLVRNLQLIGKGCGQTSRIDALRQAIDKAHLSGFETAGAVLSSDAFFPFDDCVKIADEAGIIAFIQPGGSIRDNDSIQYCELKKLPMIITGTRHFKH